MSPEANEVASNTNEGKQNNRSQAILIRFGFWSYGQSPGAEKIEVI